MLMGGSVPVRRSKGTIVALLEPSKMGHPCGYLPTRLAQNKAGNRILGYPVL